MSVIGNFKRFGNVLLSAVSYKKLSLGANVLNVKRTIAHLTALYFGYSGLENENNMEQVSMIT